ncbi:hypothetical protein [Rhodoferax aquaticus]|uniref:Uncharacterized protein n=1 Tax=Rhodoferax aquaticus TaxID=2527691 RepID=A0A515EQY4_9BURK|nr:hypothetical protein [Rhodoferax aquaticus]QDL55077.1 hypothetical protein EXZ61_13375 [Rhodoferax aquaticus]
MSAKNLSTVTNELIESYGNTAKNVINAYRVGNERAVGYADQAWANGVQKVGKRISADVRNNALSAQKKISALYVQGVTLTSDGADVAVNKAVALAGKGVAQVAANASRFEQATGLDTLSTLAVAAVPAAEAAISVAAKLEASSGALVNKISGKKAKVKVAMPKRPVAKKAAPAAKPAAKPAAPKAAAPKAKAAPAKAAAKPAEPKAAAAPAVAA